MGLPSRVARVLTVYDVVWLLHPDTMEEINRSALNRFAARGIRQAHKIMAISESTRRGLIEAAGAPGGKIEVVHLAVKAGDFTPHDRERSARFIAEKYGVSPDYICTVGTVEPRKNIITLIEAVRMLRQRGQLRHQLLIAGQSGWNNSAIYASVESCGLTEREVKFLGRIPEEDLPQFYSGAALFIFPSLYEGFGLPLLEAMSSGTPIVASNTSSIPEVTEDAAVLVSPRDPGAFADAIVRVTSDAALGQSLVEKGLKRARGFTWEAAALKVRRILEEAKAAAM
jgi:glycosyltransferase involved in cell wall biosynthesis